MSGWFVETGISFGSLSNSASKNKSIVRGLAYHRRLYRLLTLWQRKNAPEQILHIEPWLRNGKTKKLLQPDAVLECPLTRTAITIEVKLNWKDGRDEKLIQHYLPAVESAYGLCATWPALITSNVAGLKQKPNLGLGALEDCIYWCAGQPTPVLLVL